MWGTQTKDVLSQAPEDSQAYDYSQQDVPGFSQSLSQSLSQHNLNYTGLSQSQGLPEEPTCVECQATEFSTTDQGDMVRHVTFVRTDSFLLMTKVIWMCAIRVREIFLVVIGHHVGG